MSWFDYFLPEKEKQDAEKKKDSSLVFSSTGTEIYSGYLEEEYLGKLRDMRNRFNVYDEMRRSSGVINMCIGAVLRPMESAKWTYKIKDEFMHDSAAEQQLEFINECFPVNDLKTLVAEMALSVLYGFSLHEKFYQPVIINGQTKLRPRIKFISQRTIKQWIIDEDSNWLGVKQAAYGDSSPKTDKFISSESLIHFAVNQEGDNYEGISFLRPVYGNWVRKNTNYKKIAIGNNFLSLPFLKIYQDEDVLDDENWKRFEDRLTQRASSGRQLSHLVFPPKMKGEEQDSKFDPIKLYSCNTQEDEEIIRSFSCNFLLLTKGSGSFALSNDLSTFFTAGLEAIASRIDALIDNKLINDIVKMNFDAEVMVECTHSEIGGRGGAALAKSISALFGAKSITPDEPTEDWVRTKFGMPAADLETRRTPQSEIPLPDDEKDDDEEDDDENPIINKNKKKQKELSANRAGLISEANKSVKRIKKMRDEGLVLLKNELSLLTEKKINIVLSHFKKTKGTQKVFALNPKTISVSTAHAAKVMKDFLQEGVNNQIKDLRDSLSLQSPDLPAILKITAFIATTDVEEAVKAVDNAVMFTYFDSIAQGQDLADIKLVLTQSTKSVIEGKKIAQKTSVLPSKAVNMARQKVFEENYSDIESYTFFNPDPTAPVCFEIAGKTVAAGDPVLKTYQPPLHYNCSTVIIPNTKTMRNSPKPKPFSISQKAADSINVGVKSSLY